MIKKLGKLSIVCVLLLNLSLNIFYHKSYAGVLQPTDDQKIEYRATSVKKVNSKYQLRIEIWLHHLTFKGFALRTNYDSNQIKPSDPTLNTEIQLLQTVLIKLYFVLPNPTNILSGICWNAYGTKNGKTIITISNILL